jgi:nardilysin
VEADIEYQQLRNSTVEMEQDTEQNDGDLTGEEERQSYDEERQKEEVEEEKGEELKNVEEEEGGEDENEYDEDDDIDQDDAMELLLANAAISLEDNFASE